MPACCSSRTIPRSDRQDEVVDRPGQLRQLHRHAHHVLVGRVAVRAPRPTKVYLYPSRVEVTSYPGPVPGIEPQHLVPDSHVPAVPARNRRIGEFLKELKLAETRFRLPKVFQAMEANGSPAPRFDFDAADLVPSHAARSSGVRGALGVT